MRLRLLALVALLPLGACSSVMEAVKGPELAPVGYPAALVPREQAIMPLSAPRDEPRPASANSLWRTGAREFFADQRAAKVGDILTVLIEIDDSAKTTNQTTTSHQSDMNAGIPHLLGLESTLGRILPKKFDPANALGTNTKTDQAGSGAITRSEKMSLTIAAVVTTVLPNGNMVIQGVQEVRTNSELRQLTVAGIVRPEDVSSANTVRHTQIAEARISYGGRGDISRVQKTPGGQALVEKYWPF